MLYIKNITKKTKEEKQKIDEGILAYQDTYLKLNHLKFSIVFYSGYYDQDLIPKNNGIKAIINKIVIPCTKLLYNKCFY